MATFNFKLCICFLFPLFCLVYNDSSILCEVGFCRTHLHDTGCTTPPIHCSVNNETHRGINLLSPTVCNCCEYCMPLYGEGEHCSRGGPGTGSTVGRCGDGLYCWPGEEDNYCGRRCSRFHDLMNSVIGSGVPAPVVGPRCTADGNYFPIRCINNICYCVDKITGIISKDYPTVHIDLERQSIAQLPCYEKDLDLFEEFDKEHPSIFSSPCLLNQAEMVAEVLDSEEDEFNLDFFGGFPECLPDWTFGRIAVNSAGQKVCVDERGRQIENYHADRKTDPAAYNNMDCKCALTRKLMGDLPEKPVCCRNGNFRRIQCRRGMCRCVDSDGRQTQKETSDVTELKCYDNDTDWRTC